MVDHEADLRLQACGQLDPGRLSALKGRRPGRTAVLRAAPGSAGARLLPVAFLLAACVSGGGAEPRSRPGLETKDEARVARPARGEADAGASDAAAGLTGGCGPAPAGLAPKYILPFPPGEAFPLTQGNCGGVSHSGRFAYAYDFRMPVGTPVIATRDGIVAAARDHRPDGTRALGDENFVFLEHEDGEISRYIHLRRGGSLVEPGESVSRGDTIAWSGDSGRSAFPHLHFDVAGRCDTGGCYTIASAFLNSVPPIPIESGNYFALPLASAVTDDGR